MSDFERMRKMAKRKMEWDGMDNEMKNKREGENLINIYHDNIEINKDRASLPQSMMVVGTTISSKEEVQMKNIIIVITFLLGALVLGKYNYRHCHKATGYNFKYNLNLEYNSNS